jgi:hypothetical protein
MEEQYIITNADGVKFYYKDKEQTILHREDGPAVEHTSGTKEWYVNGKRHRLDGPAFEHAGGSKSWYVNGKRHRIDGPAIEWANGEKAWYVNGVFIMLVDRSGQLIKRME